MANDPRFTSVNELNISENNTDVVYLLRKTTIEDKELTPLDHLVMTAVLLVSLGLSLSRTIKYRGAKETTTQVKAEIKVTNKDEPKTPPSTTQVLYDTITTAGATTSPYINTLCLFGLAGEIYKNDGAVIFFLIGILLSIFCLLFFRYFSIIANNQIRSFPSYLRKRFQRKGISVIVAVSSILRHFIGGALNLCTMGIGISAMTDLPALVTSVIIASAAVFCSSMSRIHSGSNSSIGGILIWLVGITSLITLTVSTVNEGGFEQLFSKAYQLGKLRLPDLSPAPWIKGSIWGYVATGMVLGFQVFAFSRSTLRHAMSDLSDKVFYGSICMTFVLISIWTLIAFWGGICASVIFEGKEVPLPDGLLAKLVSKEMQEIRGFRGFFVSTLLAASISGLTRRYNQLIELIWETTRDIFFPNYRQQTNVSKYLKKHAIDLPEEYVKELTWEEGKKSCMPQFCYKFAVGCVIGFLSCFCVYVFLGLRITVWELWLSILGIFIGPMVAVMLIGLFVPCVSHMSVCLGLLIGWIIPCFLMIGSKAPEFSSYVSVYSNSEPLPTPSEVYIPEKDSPLSLLNITLKETVFIFYNDRKAEEIMNDLENNANQHVPTKRPRRRMKITNILTTCYCYYAPIGMLSCIVCSFLFAAISGKCSSTKLTPESVELLHPFVRKKYLSYVNVVRIDDTPMTDRGVISPATPDPRRRKKINALKFLQETAHI